jgi:hypothetical protein
MSGVAERAAVDRARAQAHHLANASMLPGTKDKRFSQEMGKKVRNDKFFTLGQIAKLEKMAWKYRRQMPAHLVPNAKP